MSCKNYFDIPQPAPICAGTGLLALDLVINKDKKTEPKLCAGGSCGNVLAILSYLGWEAYPIARLTKDAAAEEIRNDLNHFNVKLDLVESDASGSTPIIIEQISAKQDGTPTHSFRLVCPNCGIHFPRYKPILVQKSRQLTGKLPEIKTFYFDKLSAGAIELARIMRERGALVVFEPSSIGNKSLFERALSVCHVFKYAGDRLGHVKELAEELIPILQIETLGIQGLKYRLKVRNKQQKRWEVMPAFKVDSLRDAAGCGDWCTAGIIHLLGRHGSAKLESALKNEIDDALQFGQALAALNCYFEGARGGMYALTKEELKQAVEEIMQGNKPEFDVPDSLSEDSNDILLRICPNCAKQQAISLTKSKEVRKVSLTSSSADNTPNIFTQPAQLC